MRQFIRHPLEVPIEVRCDDAAELAEVHTQDISAGGLALHSSQSVPPGRRIEVCIPHVQPAFEARARVVWCRPGVHGGFELGVAFLDAKDAFLARMVEQVCYIEDYRRFVLMHEGRELSQDDAASEWIAKYAAQFPAIGIDPH